MSNQEKQQPKVKVDIEPAQFKDLMQVQYTTLSKIKLQISEFFSAMFKDFEGVEINPIPNGAGFVVRAYFCKHPVDNCGAVSAFSVAGDSNSNQESSILSVLRGISTTTKMYKMTEEGQELLLKYYNTYGNGKFNWGQVLTETQPKSTFNTKTYACLSGMNIDKILTDIFGNKVDDSYVQYQILPIKPIPNGFNGGNDWVISISRIKVNTLNSLASELGVIVSTGDMNIPMTRRIN